MDDVARLRSRADRLQLAATRLREEAQRLDAALDVEWVSASADDWRRECRATMADLRREADRLDDTAAAFRRHATHVEDAQAAAARARDWFLGQLADARRTLAAGADAVGDAAVAAAREITNAARHAPAPWSPDWRWWRG